MIFELKRGTAGRGGKRGFTLFEMIFVLLVAAVLLLWGMPSVVQSIRNNQVASQSVSLLAMLNFTKSESIRRNTEVNIVFTLREGGWDAIVEDPTNEAEIEGCVIGQLRCTSNDGALLTVASIETGSSSVASAKSGASPDKPKKPKPDPDPDPAPDPEPDPDPPVGDDPPGEGDPAVESGDSFTLTFNNRGYIRGSEDAWVAETFFLQHENCSGQNQRRRVDITPTGQVSSCSLACNSTAACP